MFGGTRAIPEMCEFPAPDYSAATFIYSEPCGGWRQVELSNPRRRFLMAGPCNRPRKAVSGLATMGISAKRAAKPISP